MFKCIKEMLIDPIKEGWEEGFSCGESIVGAAQKSDTDWTVLGERH